MVLLTGGTGVLGGYLIPELISSGHPVRLLVRDTKPSTLATLPKSVEIVEGDVLDILTLMEAMTGVKQVVHAAALVSSRVADTGLMKQINETGTANVVNACLEVGVERLLHVSSVAALGRKHGGLTSEQDRFRDSPNRSAYGYSKYLAEKQVFRGIEEGLKAVICNPSVILGVHPSGRSSAELLTRAQKSTIVCPAGSNGFVGGTDVARAICVLLASELGSGERFIVSSENLTYRQVLEQFAFALGHHPRFIGLSASTANVLAWLLKFLREPIAIGADRFRISAEDYAYDNSFMKNTFRFEFTPIAKVVYDVVAQHLESQGIRTQPTPSINV
jgi:dihydroflavonol-4-reductase